MARTKRIEHHPVVRLFAARLRAQRKTCGMTQTQLANRAGVNFNYIGKLERGEVAPGLDMVGRLAEAFGIGVESLVSDPLLAKSALPTLREHLSKLMKRLMSRDDEHVLQAMSVIVSLVESALAQREK